MFKLLLLKICFWGRAQAVERRGAFDGRRISLNRVIYYAWIAHREVQAAVHNQAATGVAEVHQSYVLKTDTSKKLSRMKVRLVARKMRSDTGLHDLLGG